MNAIDLTPEAVAQLETLLSAHPDQHIRVSINNKGCSGHSYVWDLVREDEIHKLDMQIKLNQGMLVIEHKSLLKLWGSQLHYERDAFGAQFVWMNPNVKHKCGCGESVGF